ncbi:MAG: hypothetical protein FWE67_13540, partial [Planctomycetaceae bacterium]|nr:hypothetical protein [Planctomycetaceae bacterium]
FFGLHGQSVLPMILAGGIVGGCAVPAILATRAMRGQRERILTIMVAPLMNCGAKIPVYALLIAAFFSAYQGLIMAVLILTSWSTALIAASVLSRTVVKGTPAPLVLELPAYQIPQLRDIFQTAFLQSWWFIKKAGTFILAVNIVLWALMYYPVPKDAGASKSERLQNSYAARLGRCLEPVSQFAGFDWRDNVALIGGFAAKEAIVASLETIYGIENEVQPKRFRASAKTENSLAAKIQNDEKWSPQKAFAMLIFVMIYAPCIAACVVIRQETGSWKYTFITMMYTTALAAILAITVYQFSGGS